MIPDGIYTAVVDRIEESLVTLEVEGDEDLYSLVVAEDDVPEAARHQDAVVRLELADETPVRVTYEKETTHERRTGAQERFDRLSRRPSRDDPDASG